MRRRGFTLMELLVVAIILTVFIAVLSVAVLQARSVFETTDILVKLQENVRLAVRKMSADLRRTAPGQISITQNIPVAGTDRIVYFLPMDAGGDGNPDYTINGTTWSASATTISLDAGGTGRLLKTVGGDTLILAQNVKSVRFIDSSINSSLYLDEVQIVMELEDTSFEGRVHNIVSTSVINMRN